MIDVSQEVGQPFLQCSAGVITGLGMYFAQFILSAIPRLFVIIANQ